MSTTRDREPAKGLHTFVAAEATNVLSLREEVPFVAAMRPSRWTVVS